MRYIAWHSWDGIEGNLLGIERERVGRLVRWRRVTAVVPMGVTQADQSTWEGNLKVATRSKWSEWESTGGRKARQ